MNRNRFTQLIRSDMAVSFGVTEPGAIAFAVSRAKSLTKGEIKKITLSVNSGIYKNSFTCGIPGTRETGIPYAAALGAVAGDWTKGLEALSGITEQDIDAARELILAGKIQVDLSGISSELLINAMVATESSTAEVIIREHHTNIVRILVNGECVYQKEEESGGKTGEESTSVTSASFSELWEYACTVPGEEIEFIKKAYEANLALAEEGAASKLCPLCKQFLRQNGGFYSSDPRRTALAITSAAIEARVRGIPKPAMSITGSGNHGIIATLPLYAYCKSRGIGIEKLFRATALSYLVTEYIKEYSGKLSAFCGCAIAAGTGAAVGLCFLSGGSRKEGEAVIANMASSITGVICTGGNPACTLKAAMAVDIGFQAVELARSGVSVEAEHGINGRSAEETMRNIGRIASPGMEATEGTILAIMADKLKNG